MWHVSSRSSVATLRTAIHLLLVTYLWQRCTLVPLSASHSTTRPWHWCSKITFTTCDSLLRHQHGCEVYFCISFCLFKLLLLILLLLHLFNSLLSRTTWVSWYQKGQTSLDLNQARDHRVLGCSGISWTICKQSAPRCRQITTPTPHHSIFTGWMLFLTSYQQSWRICQKTTHPNFTIFSVHVAMAVAQFSSDDSAMLYVLPVLWIMARLRRLSSDVFVGLTGVPNTIAMNGSRRGQWRLTRSGHQFLGHTAVNI